MNGARIASRIVLLSALAGVLGCDEEPVQKAERVRAIKPYFVVEPAGGDVRRYSGTISASNTSDLSFAVAGTVKTVAVNKGDRVAKGQVLATLDPKPFALNVQAARSEVNAARAEVTNKRAELDRQRKLFKRGWVAKARLDGAVTEFEAAEGKLNLARSRLGLAERDMRQTQLEAPFDGVIALRDVNPFVEVKIGQKVFQIDSQGAYEVDLSIPDTIIGRLSIGAPVTIDAATVAGCGCRGPDHRDRLGRGRRERRAGHGRDPGRPERAAAGHGGRGQPCPREQRWTAWLPGPARRHCAGRQGRPRLRFQIRRVRRRGPQDPGHRQRRGARKPCRHYRRCCRR